MMMRGAEKRKQEDRGMVRKGERMRGKGNIW